MKISWTQLKTLINLQDISIEDTTSKLTLAGLEVENLEYINQKQRKMVCNNTRAGHAKKYQTAKQ